MDEGNRKDEEVVLGSHLSQTPQQRHSNAGHDKHLNLETNVGESRVLKLKSTTLCNGSTRSHVRSIDTPH